MSGGLSKGPAIVLDPILAATTYLDHVPKAARMLAAARTEAGHWRIGFAWTFVGVTLILVQKSRLVERVRDQLAALASHDWLASLLCAAAFLFLMDTALIVAAAIAATVWPAGAESPTTLAKTALQMPVQALMGGLVLWSVVAVLRRWPRWAWAGLSGVATGLIFCAVLVPPVALAPIVRHDGRATGAQAAPLLAFVRRGGLDAKSLSVFDSADPLAVDMEGLGPIAHAAVSRAALAEPRPETYAAIGHLLGHYRYRDLWSLALIWSAFATSFFFAARLGLSPLARRGGRTAPNSAIDAKAYPVVGLIGWGLVLIATPAFNVFDHTINYRADDYAISLTRDPDALCRWLMATEAGDKADPSLPEAVLFYDHPPLKARLINALYWATANHLL